MEKSTIVLLEDDYFFRDLNSKFLLRHFQKHEVIALGTEHAFREALPRITANPPLFAVLGMRVKWHDCDPDMPIPPPEVLAESTRLTGLRCWRLLRANEATKRVPVIFYTIIDERGNAKEALADPHVQFVEMRDASEEYDLLPAIERAMQQ